MKHEYDFSKTKRGRIAPPRGKTARVTIPIDVEVLDWFRARVHAGGGGDYSALMNEALRVFVARHRTRKRRGVSSEARTNRNGRN
jgi:uncharacterized protein (DUF4415 family)